MLKHLLLFSCGALLAFNSQAQLTAKYEVKLPGEAVPGAAKPAVHAARTTTISQPQELLIQDWTNSAWTDHSRQVYLRYGAPTLPGTIRTDLKSGGAWVTDFAHRYRYTSAGEILSDTTDQYQQAPYGAYTALVNAFDTPSQARQGWITFKDPTVSTAPWDSARRYTHTYNAAGKRTQLLEDTYLGGAFTALVRRLWSYNALGQVSVYETQSRAGAAWDPLQRATYAYNAAGKVRQYVVESAGLTSGVYGNSSRHTFSFDAQGREILLTSENWDNAWGPSSQTAYAYAANGDLTTATLQAWNPSTSAYQNAQRIVLTYAQVTATRNTLQISSRLTVAPNPGADAQVHFALLTPAVASVEVFDLTGRRVAVAQPAAPYAAGEHAVSLAGAALAPGLYLVKLRAGDQHAQVKWDKR